MSNRARRNRRREAGRRQTAIRVQGELKLLGLSVALSTVLAFALANVMPDLPHGPAAFMSFGALTTLLAAGWIRRDAGRAFRFAAEHHYLGFEDNPPRVISIAQDCPKRCLVLLHIELNPDLISHLPPA
jgi:hypothetical protein